MPTGVHGLSPRVRGNLNLNVTGPAVYRSIPACAGEPVRILFVSTHDKVYPRVCGGTVSLPVPPPAT